MCHFITLVAPTRDADAVAKIMRRYGRDAKATDNPSMRQILLAGEQQYLTTRGHCDCGTVLAPRKLKSSSQIEEKLTEEAAALARKGWSKTKIDRHIADRRKAASRPDGGGDDSLELWGEIVVALLNELPLPHVGLFVHWYSGSIESEAFLATRRKVPAGKSLREALASIEPDQVTIFGGDRTAA